MEEFIWITESGEKLPVPIMNTKHIINNIRWLVNDESFGSLYKDNLSDVEWVSILSQELYDRMHLQEEEE